MKKVTIAISLVFLFISSYSQPDFYECTIGVAHGSVTEDGRPLIWKTRDYVSNHMGLKYKAVYNYKYIYIFDDTWVNFTTSGLNEHGLALVKSDVYDLTPAPTGPNASQIEWYAFANCKTIDEFQAYLDSTNITGRKTVGNYAMIDSTGAAVIFEVGGYEYWRFDANTLNDGLVVRTNFTINGGGNTGLERYNRSIDLISDFSSGDTLNHKNLIRYHLRDFSDASSQPYPIPYLNQANPNFPYGYFDTYFSICNYNSTSTAVIQGILPGEKPELSTMWAMLGHPAASITSPYWPVGTEPSIAQISLCDVALMIKEKLFDLPTSPRWINSHLLRDSLAGGLWTCTFPTEDYILDYAETFLNNWRSLDSVPVAQMLDIENELAQMVYDSLSSYYLSVGVETLVDNIEFIIYPNPASQSLNISAEGFIIEEATIYALTGQQVLQQRPVNGIIDISSLQPGMYIVEVMIENTRIRQKLLVQR